MKKIIIIGILSILLVSCGNVEKNESTNDKLDTIEKSTMDNNIVENINILDKDNIDSDILEKQKTDNLKKQNLDNQISEQQKLEQERLEQKKLEQEKKFNKRKEMLDKTFEHYSTLSLVFKSQLNCNELSPVLPGMTENEKQLAKKTTEKCIEIKMNARKELQKAEKGFSILNCRKTIEEREKQFEKFNNSQDLPKGVKLPSKEERQQFIEQEIETCEIGYALQENNCDLLKDETKKQKCERFNELKQEKIMLDQLLNFKKADYIK